MIWGINKRSKTAVIKLPNIFSRETMFVLLGAVLDENHDYRHRRITLDFSSLSAIQVGGVAVICNLIEAARKAGSKVDLAGVEECKAAKFLKGSGFSDLYVRNSFKNEKNKEHLTLRLVGYEKSQSYIRDHAIPWIASIIGSDERALGNLQVCLEEIFNNIVDHSTIDVGCTYANFDRSKNLIHFCISDFGIGIPANVRKKMQIGTDSGAISMACKEGFTTQTTGRNRGAGLHILLNNIVVRNRGFVQIFSGKGVYSCQNMAGKLKASGKNVDGSYPGTMIYMQIDVRSFRPDDISEDFSWE